MKSKEYKVVIGEYTAYSRPEIAPWGEFGSIYVYKNKKFVSHAITSFAFNGDQLKDFLIKQIEEDKKNDK